MYMFGLLSEELKDKFHLTQSSLDFVGSSATVGSQFGIHMGYFFDVFGPRATLGLGGLLSALGFLLMWLAIHFALPISTAPLSVITFLFGQGQLTMDLAIIPTLASNFPNHRGMAVGMAKAFVGLSGSLATAVYNGFLYPDVVGFLLLLVAWISVACTVGVVFIQRCPAVELPSLPRAKDFARQWLTTGFACTYFMCAVLLAVALCESFVQVSKGVRIMFALCIITVNLMIVTFLGTRREPSLDQAQSSVDMASLTEQQESERSGERSRPLQHQMTLVEALCTGDFWLHWCASSLATGGGLLLINNIAQVNLALGRDDESGIVFISLLSISNCLGRITSGTLSDWLLAIYPGFPRPLFLAGTTALSGAMLAVFAWMPHAGTLYAAVSVVGAGYGAVNALNPVVAAENFGVKHLGSIYTALSVSMAVASYGCATFLFGEVYDAHSNGACVVDEACHSGDSPACSSAGARHQESCCLGAACTTLSFGVTAAGSMLAVCFFALLACRTRQRYLPSEARSCQCRP